MVQYISTDKYATTLSFSLFNTLSKSLNLSFGVEGANKSVGVKRITNFDGLISSDHSLSHNVKD